MSLGDAQADAPARVSMPVAVAVTVVAVVGSALLGQALAGDDPFPTLDAYRQPWFALPAWGWVVVGIVYYLALAVVLLRIVRRLPAARVAAGLVVAVLVANEAWNLLVFVVRAPWAAFVGLVAFAVLLGITARVVHRHDVTSARVLGVYLAWVLVYDLPWALALALLN